MSRSRTERMMARFNHLMRELKVGLIERTTFQPWEVELMVDIATSDVNGLPLRHVLNTYQRAVRRQMMKGASLPLKFSVYLEAARQRHKDPQWARVEG